MSTAGSHRERLLSTVAGDEVDRPPISFWGHVYHRESTAEDLAEHTLERWRRYEWDFVKLNPRASYHGEVWGLTMQYSGVPNEKPKRVDYPVRAIEDWDAVRERPADSPALAEQLEAVRRVRAGLPDDVLLIETVFSPLSIAADLADTPEVVRDHLREDEARVLSAVGAIAGTFRGYVERLLEAGADGIFFATVDWATRDLVTPEEYARWARPTDLRVLETARGATFNVLHVCRRNNLLSELAGYPAHAYSWAATEEGNPTLDEGLAFLPGAAAGGIDHEGAVLDESPEAVLAELEDGFRRTGGRRWIVAPGCSIPPQTPPRNLDALRNALMERANSRSPSRR